MQPLASSTAPTEEIQCKQHAAASAIARVTVSKAIDEAVAWILSDPSECFLYKFPRECEQRPNTNNRLQLAQIAALETYGASTSAKERRSSVRAVTKSNVRRRIDWLRIDEVSLHRVVQLVYDYLSLWRLTPNTQYLVRLEKNALCEESQGRSYCLSALFTRQPQCDLEHCRPLAMAQVNFKVHVSHLLPKFYPVMMTYRFENCNTVYYALGHRRMRRLDFQRFFIDMALETKFGFYAQLLRTLALSPSRRFIVKQRGSKSEEEKKEGAEARTKRLKSSAPLCICAAEESVSQMKKKSSRDKEQTVNVSAQENVRGASENLVMTASCSHVMTCDMRSAESREGNSENSGSLKK
ncbi:uncharacterized protein LOC118748266 [Rhagoletis pomonella]|uniref:uncharacterized protein LOC118748266 n=1 Tax=Rhagoletis pomonella TaxID=28610 RepID=UPI00177ECE27|nr:uncharacterized protein LOC118748266 [Rhagoletis pomonella]